MAEFYDIHRKAIERAFNVGSQRVGDYFRIGMMEPLGAPSEFASMADDHFLIITFRRLPEGRYEPAELSDRKEIREWNIRHQLTPADAWELPRGLIRPANAG
jgi:hypothetical protein